MSERKTEVVNLRMSPRVKGLLRVAADYECRTLSNMLEVLILNFCHTNGLDTGSADSNQAAAQPSEVSAH
jgi:hypothetical protein